MKYRYLYSALVSACIAFTGCSDDVLEEQKNVPWEEGDGIVFGARAGFENDQKDSRTIYTGERYEDEFGVSYERVEWLVGDKVSIYSPQAYVSGGGLFADYEVTEHHAEEVPELGTGNTHKTVDFATLKPVKANNALQWGAAETHTFYACYPTQASTTASDRSAIVLSKIEGNPNGLHIKGRIPVNQIPKSITSEQKGENKVYTAAPFMQNAHMVAVGNAQKSVGQSVDLSFKAICTALELEFTGGESPTTLSSIRISSKKNKVAGQYECDLTSAEDYPACTNVDVAEAGNAIMVPLFNKGAKDLYGTTLNPGDKLKVTVFLLPTADFNDLTVTVVTPAGRKSHLLNNTSGTITSNLTFEAHKKHYVKNIKLPKGYNFKNWMGNINDNVYVHQLSIPGSGSSFSNTYKSTNADYEYYQTQTLPIAEQWNKGIRCFEIISDRGTWSFGNFFEPVSLTDQPVIGAKGTDLSLTVSQAVEQIYQLVKANPTEFAMIVMTYQPEKNRNGKKYMGTFDAFYRTSFLAGKDEAKDVAKYDPNEILGNVRGKVMFLLRPTSDGEDMLVSTDLTTYANKNYTIINGWGSLQDKWKQRGYPVIDTDSIDGVNGNSAYFDYEGSIEKGMIRGVGAGSGPFDLKNKVDTKIDYGYNTNNPNLSVWAQEWNRVIPETKVVTFNTTQRVYWRESYSEKLADAKLTFDKACQNTSENILFFNCLTGYFVNFADEDTYRPARKLASGSAHGNVVTFADKINTEFFAHVWDKWNARETGPLGVVMMNRINSGDITTNPGNFYMPNVVISNNFSYPLKQRQ